jgi:hypothetical protein
MLAVKKGTPNEDGIAADKETEILGDTLSDS